MTTFIHTAPTAQKSCPRSPSAAVSERAVRAHEQKNCLSIILAVAALVTPELAPEGRKRMQRLRAAVRRMRDLLDVDLEHTGEGTIDTDVDVERFFDLVCESLRDRAEAAKVALVVRCAGGVVRGHVAELREAIFNLVSNAIDATPPNRPVLVHADFNEAGEHEWRIQDNGVGMRREVVEQLGVPYRSFREGGTGLGIAIARTVVERHAGTLRFDSIAGSGTTVTICLPCERAVRSRAHRRTEGDALED